MNISISLDYSSSLQQYYQKLKHLPGFVLLESTDTQRGRYDLLSAYPYERIIIHEHSPNKLAILDYFCEIFAKESSESQLPFQGGAIGYISYDLGALLQGIISTPQDVLKGMPLMDMGLYDWAIIVDHHLKEITLFSANTQTETPNIIKEIKTLWQSNNKDLEAFSLHSDFSAQIPKEQYLNSFSRIHQSIREGRAYQVNYTQPFQAEFCGDAWAIYRKVSAKNPVPYSAFLKTEQATVLSFSPERFLLYNQGDLLTSPIKGTIGRSTVPMEDEFLKNQLINCSKNRAENVMIVDLLRNDLGKIAKPGTVEVTNLCSLESYHSVHHLVSDIQALCLENVNSINAFLSCFPGGSITGAPKREAMKIIQEEEYYGRGVYCGSIAYVSRHGRIDSNIAIRTMIARQNQLQLAAGGGIVIGSQCEEEYSECFTKIAGIIKGLK